MGTIAATNANLELGSDEARTKRLFIGFLSSVLGVDQTMTGEDGLPSSPTGVYTIANPDGTYSVQGQSVSNQNTGAGAVAGISPGMLLLLVGLVFVLAQ